MLEGITITSSPRRRANVVSVTTTTAGGASRFKYDSVSLLPAMAMVLPIWQVLDDGLHRAPAAPPRHHRQHQHGRQHRARSRRHRVTIASARASPGPRRPGFDTAPKPRSRQHHDADRRPIAPCFPSRRPCVCPYRARLLGFARLEVSAAYLGREARMRAIGIAVFAVCFLAVVYAAFDLRRDHSQINRIREECQHWQSDRMHCRLGASAREATGVAVNPDLSTATAAVRPR
jgi:hypothetical protein